MNECRHMRAFVIVLLKQGGSGYGWGRQGIGIGTSSEWMEEARAQVKDETVRIINNAMNRGEYNDKFSNDVFIAGVSFISPVRDSITVEGDGYYDTDAMSEDGTAATTRDKMSTGKAYGIIFMAGVAVIMAAVAILVTKAFRDGRRRRYSKRRERRRDARNHDDDKKKTKSTTWDTDRIATLETESDEDDLEVTLYIRSPRNASDRKRGKDESTSPKVGVLQVSDVDVFDDNIAEMALHERSPRGSPQRKPLQFNPSECKKPNEDGKDDEGTEATASISQITRNSLGREPIYEDEMEI